MKRIGVLIGLLMILAIVGKMNAQTPVCNVSAYFSLDEDCMHVITLEELENVIPNCVVELDKTLPFGDGPWESPAVGPADINHFYMARIRHVPTGNQCTTSVKIEDKLPPILHCTEVSTVNLDNGNPALLSTTDLNITATDACSAITLSPATLQYDCDDISVKTIQLTATDASGNTATCQHTVVITSDTACLSPCVSVCPASVVVSYDEGNDVLLPAFQNNDWSAFDPYGHPLFDPGCIALDSTYFVDYQAGAAGQSWFTRLWVWIEASTGAFTLCKQSVVFPLTHTVTVQGKVYLDTDADCNADSSEQGVNFFPIVITELPSGPTRVITPEADGTYSVNIVFSPQDSAAQLRLSLPNSVTSVCPSALIIPNSTATPLYNFDIGLLSQGDCPLMQADLGALSSRRCAPNSFAVQYCNAGLDTAYNAYVTIHLDSLISLQSATLPYTVGAADNTYTFQVGDVSPFHCNTFYLNTWVSCDAQIGQTLCNEVTAYPNIPCNGPWEGVFVTTTASCTGDTVSLAIWNQGQADMTAPLNFIVIEDFIMYKNDSFQLHAGDSMTIKAPANGATWRIEAEQTPGFPIAGLTAAAIEGCGGLNTPGLINAFFQSDNAIYYDQECIEVRGSYDPNDKTAVPTGYRTEHFIRANEAIEYQIRFQNTGNDTAFQVVIVDTLSASLDPLTLEAGAASHPYRLNVYPGGILHFVFKPIALPDSNVNEAASQGFIQFRIAQRPDLPGGTVIRNTGAIYFDQNAPVMTNTAYHTIGYPFQLVDSWTPYVPGLEVTLSPNPFRDQAVLAVTGKQLSRGRVLLYDAQGRLVQSQEMTANRAVLHRGNLPGGLYFFQIMEQGVGVAGGKILVD